MSTPRAALMIAISLALGACERGSSAPLVEPEVDPNAPAFTVVPSTTIISAARGWNAFVKFSITRRRDYAEAITLATVDLPAGVTGSFATPTLAPASSETRLDLEVDTLATPGTYMFAVHVTGAHSPPSVTNFSITVPRPSFTLFGLGSPGGSVTPSQGSGLPLIINGFQVTLGFRILRENSFRGPVTIALSDIPAGVIGANTYTFHGNDAGITFRAGPDAIPGTYKVGVKATGADVEERTSVLTLLILPPT